MIRVAICDDEKIYVDMIRTEVEKICDSSQIEYEIDEFNSGEAMLDGLKCTKYDLVLLDILMPNVGGFDVAEEIHKVTGGDNLLFVSNEERLVYQTFSFRPLGFVRKMYLEEELKREFHKWYDRYGKKLVISFTYGKDKEEMHLRAEDIHYIEARGHYVEFHTKDNVYDEKAPISKYDYLLDAMEFVKCNRSVICNLKYVVSKKSESLTLVGGQRISIGRTHKEEAWKKYNDYIRYECIGD